jgi:hypothetical protein
MGGGIGYPTTPSQSKGTYPRLGGRVLGESKNLSCSKGIVPEMLKACLKDASVSKGRVGLIGDCIGMTTSSTIG